MKKEYAKDDLVVVWQPTKCFHAGVCVKMLPKVYRVGERPWLHPEFATKEELVEQIDKCPSGALSYYFK
jgi:uncharacterized Fe-S cluster protein YjdI